MSIMSAKTRMFEKLVKELKILAPELPGISSSSKIEEIKRFREAFDKANSAGTLSPRVQEVVLVLGLMSGRQLSTTQIRQHSLLVMATPEAAIDWVDSRKDEITRAARKHTDGIPNFPLDDADIHQDARVVALSAIRIHQEKPDSDFLKVFGAEWTKHIFHNYVRFYELQNDYQHMLDNIMESDQANCDNTKQKTCLVDTAIKTFVTTLPCPDSPESIEQIKKAVKEFRVAWQPVSSKKPSLAQTYQMVAKALGFKTWEAMVAVATRAEKIPISATNRASLDAKNLLAEITSFEQLKDLEPRLVALEDLLQSVVNRHSDKPYWCANYYWYGLIKPRLTRIIGFARNSKPVDRSQMPRIEAGGLSVIKASDLPSLSPTDDKDPLATSKVYELAYSALESMLPPCRHNNYGCPPYGDLANSARTFSNTAILGFLADCVFSPKTNTVEEPYIKVITKLLHELEAHGSCPSVAWPDKLYPNEEPASDGAFQKLSKISLLDHSLRVARLSVGNKLPKGVSKGEAIIAALAHDLGKIPKYRAIHEPQGVDHPWVSASILGGFQELYGVPLAKQGRAEYILDAVAGHHDIASNELGNLIHTYDARARTAEMRAVKVETEKEFFNDLAKQAKLVDKGKLPKNNGTRVSLPRKTDQK